MILGACLSGLLAQSYIFENSTFNSALARGTLFNPYKLKMTHSMGFAAGTSSNGLGFYQSRYTNHLAYELSPKLNLAVDLNLVNFGSISQSSGFSFESNNDNKTKIIPEFSLSYKPTDTVSLQIEFRDMRAQNPFYRNHFDWMER